MHFTDIIPAKAFEQFRVADIPDADRPWLEKLQVGLHEGAGSKHAISSLLFSVIILALSHEVMSVGLACAIIAVIALMFVARHLAVWRQLGVTSAIDAIRYNSVVGGIGWGGIVGGLLGFGNVHHVGPLGVIGVGLILFGSISFAVDPRASYLYTVLSTTLCAGGFVARGGVENYEVAGLLAFFGMLSMVLCQFTFASFATRVLRERELKRAAETVQLLLNDFEEQASDWLWESNAQGHLVNVSDRAAQAAARSVAALSRMNMIEILSPGHEREILHGLLGQHSHFRSVVVPVNINGEARWWSISGRPVTGDEGGFAGYRGAISDITEAKRAEAQIAHMASYDALTDLPNRILFAETLSRALSRRKGPKLTAMLYLDLDNFKSINDTLGHGVGDQVLKVAANRLESCLGLNDVVSRQGGDEFAVVLNDIASRSDAQCVADQIVHALAEPIMVEGQQINSGASVGIAFAPDDATTSAELIKNADMALYHAKNNGRGRWSMFDISMHQAMQAKRQIEVDLRAAISGDELELYYQPLVNLETGNTTGYEALLRWNHPEKGMIMPGDFISVAEDTGLIVPLGEWVIRNALTEAGRWPERLAVSVNLSPAQLRSPNLVPTVVNALAASGVAPSRLEFEITETVLMQDTEANLAVLHQLRAIGVHIALDDFGTGYSSLNYLRSFPFDKIKIDRSFVDDVDSREESRAIVRAIASLASALGMVTTAEGVEREGQLNELRRQGCTEVQGYYFSKPVSAAYVGGRGSEQTISLGEVETASKPDATRHAA